ncbi:hypothetical protein ASD82_13335 [Rhodanobacter sp. Root179]|nr:hypothetical protein ASD82_13335 [Rhodanobacter sp. Root179]
MQRLVTKTVRIKYLSFIDRILCVDLKLTFYNPSDKLNIFCEVRSNAHAGEIGNLIKLIILFVWPAEFPR